MTLLMVPEHVTILRGSRSGTDEEGRAWLSNGHFAALRRLDESMGGSQSALEWTSDTARTRQWVGVLQVPGLTLEILPRLHTAGTFGATAARKNLLTMLTLSGDVPLREKDLAGQALHKAPLSETLVAIFARRLLEALLLGRDRSYEVRRENARVLRGRLMFAQHIRHNAAAGGTHFFVERAELTDDTLLSRALKATCRALLLHVRLQSTEEQLRHCLLCLSGVRDERIVPEALDKIVWTRQNARFRPLLDFSKMLLSQTAPGGSAGKVRSFSLLFDMNVVFERTIAAILRRWVMPGFPWHALHVHARHQWRYLLRRRTGRKGVLRLEPDLLIARAGAPEEHAATVDTKWKLLDQSGQKRGVSREDLFQLFAYAQRYACRHNVLLYPAVPGCRDEDFIVPPAPGQREERTISVRFVSLDRDLKVEKLAVAEELREMLAPLLERPLMDMVEI